MRVKGKKKGNRNGEKGKEKDGLRKREGMTAADLMGSSGV